MVKIDSDILLLRDLAKKVSEISRKEIQNERRGLWRNHNSLIRTRIPINVRWFNCWQEVYPDRELLCRDDFYREHERFLRQMIFQDFIEDDSIVEPWITVKARYATPTGNLRWGPEIKHIPSSEERGSWKLDPPIKEPEDMEKLIKPHHIIDEGATSRDVNRLQEAVGDILEVNLDRGPYYHIWYGDISHDLGYLRGIEQIMWDVMDRPEWLHKFVAFMADGVLAAHDEAEAASDWRMCNHWNQSMPYARELPDPKANGEGVNRDKLWIYMASQEFTQISPEMFDEFLLSYQIPIMKKFGLASYGCCEDLTRKIKYLRKIPNLRRISVTPWADVRKCAEQILQDYVISWRPNPAEMICAGFYPEQVRRIVKSAMDIFREYGCHVDIALKDIETVQGKPENLREWAKLVRNTVEDYL